MPNYLFGFQLHNGEQWDITFTAVRGHVMTHQFPQECKRWSTYPTRNLFEAGIEKVPGAVRSQPNVCETVANAVCMCEAMTAQDCHLSDSLLQQGLCRQARHLCHCLSWYRGKSMW